MKTKMLFILLLSLIVSVDLCAQDTSFYKKVALDAIDVIEKTKRQEVKESGFSVNALDISPLQNTYDNLNTIINRTIGVKVRQEGGLGSDFDLSINGMSGNSVRYFIDGVPLGTKGSELSLGNIPINLVERVEIYKGVVPASLGADALGGAINIITRQNKQRYTDISYSVGSFSTQVFNLNTQVITKSGVFIRPTIGVNDSKNNYLMKNIELWNEQLKRYTNVNRRRFHDDYFYAIGQLDLGVINRLWTDLFTVSMSLSSMDKDIQTGATQNIVYGMAKREQKATNISAKYRKTDCFVDGLGVNASLSYTWDHAVTVDSVQRKYKWDGSYINSSRNEMTGNAPSLRHYKRPLFVGNVNLDYCINNSHSLNINYLLERMHNKRYDRLDEDFTPSDDIVSKHIVGLSCHQLIFHERLENTFFIKDFLNQVDINQTDLYWITGASSAQGKSSKNYIGYGLGSRFTLSKALALKFSYEHSVRLPLTRELLGNGITVYPNLLLKPENSNNYNLGLFGHINLSSNQVFSYEINGFYRNVKDYIYAVISKVEGYSQYDNVSNVDVKGVEGEIRFTWKHRIHLLANCTYQDSRSKTKTYPDGSPRITYNNKIPNRPWLFSNLGLNFTKRDFLLKNTTLKVDCNYEYVHWFFLTWEGFGSLDSKSRIPNQHVCNLSFSESFLGEKYNISLQCTNLFDRTVYDNYMLQKPGRGFTCKFRIFIN